MSDLISRQAAIDALKRKQDDGKGDLSRFYNTIIQHDIEAIKQLPPIQPKIIKCMECIHYEADITGNPWGVCCHKDWLANNIGHNVDENGWCYRAERR